MPFASVRGVTLHYEIIGKAGPWVAIAPGGRRGIEGDPRPCIAYDFVIQRGAADRCVGHGLLISCVVWRRSAAYSRAF